MTGMGNTGRLPIDNVCIGLTIIQISSFQRCDPPMHSGHESDLAKARPGNDACPAALRQRNTAQLGTAAIPHPLS